MSKSAVPTFGLMRNFLLGPHKAKYGRAILPPAHETCFKRVVNSLTRKELCRATKPRFFIFSPLNTWALEGIHFQRDFRKGSKLFEHTQLIL